MYFRLERCGGKKKKKTHETIIKHLFKVNHEPQGPTSTWLKIGTNLGIVCVCVCVCVRLFLPKTEDSTPTLLHQTEDNIAIEDSPRLQTVANCLLTHIGVCYK